MTNAFITPDKAVADLCAELNELSPVMQWAATYVLQTSLGGFPRDLTQERDLLDALEKAALAESKP